MSSNPRPVPIIQLQQVSKVFRTEQLETRALTEIDLAVYPGEFLAISGPSGCGKSTLLSILGLIDTPSSGRYLLQGRPAERLSFSERSRLRNARIGFIFQSFNLIGDLTVLENVELPLAYAKVSGSERRRRALQALERVRMQQRLKHFPGQLSGGQQQRVAVARALVAGPSLLLADEPTGNLDSSNGTEVMQLLSELHRAGATVCMVTHDGRFASLASRTVHLLDGRVVGHPVARGQAVRTAAAHYG
jgi:putative ABC transport system ATP-binding protein